MRLARAGLGISDQAIDLRPVFHVDVLVRLVRYISSPE